VVNAMQGIAAQRAHQARALLPAVRRYAETARTAIGQARRLDEPLARFPARAVGGARGGLILFGAEQGFAGAFPEQLLDGAAADMQDRHILLIGARTATLAAERGLRIAWSASMPSKADALPALATSIIDALYDYLDETGAVPITMAYPVWSSGKGVSIVRASLLPLDLDTFPASTADLPPLVNINAADLIGDLTANMSSPRSARLRSRRSSPRMRHGCAPWRPPAATSIAGRGPAPRGAPHASGSDHQ
jgi:F-type H+-transporting ATPase subunit gamma